MRKAALIITTGLSVWASGCNSHPHSFQQRVEMQDNERETTQEVLTRLYQIKPHAREAIEHASGYAVFTGFSARLLAVGTARGKGVAIDNTTGGEAFMRMTEVSAGLGPSIRKFDLIWVFTDRDRFLDFVENGWQFQAEAAAAAKAGSVGGSWEGAVPVGPRVYLFQLTDTGLALELTLKEAKFYHDKGLEQTQSPADSGGYYRPALK